MKKNVVKQKLTEEIWCIHYSKIDAWECERGNGVIFDVDNFPIQKKIIIIKNINFITFLTINFLIYFFV